MQVESYVMEWLCFFNTPASGDLQFQNLIPDQGIASLANDHLQQQQDVTPLRSTLQRLLDDIMGPLQLERVSNLETQFQNIAELLVEVVDPQAGFFQSSIVTPAMAASALTSLLEVVKRHGDARPQLMNILNSIWSDCFSHVW